MVVLDRDIEDYHIYLVQGRGHNILREEKNRMMKQNLQVPSVPEYLKVNSHPSINLHLNHPKIFIPDIYMLAELVNALYGKKGEFQSGLIGWTNTKHKREIKNKVRKTNLERQ